MVAPRWPRKIFEEEIRRVTDAAGGQWAVIVSERQEYFAAMVPLLTAKPHEPSGSKDDDAVVVAGSPVAGGTVSHAEQQAAKAEASPCSS